MNVDPYLFPARGRKRLTQFGVRPRSDAVDPYLFPARGRKHNVVTFDIPEFHCAVDPYLFPARGRKRHLLSQRVLQKVSKLIPTFSPQGDGNFR